MFQEFEGPISTSLRQGNTAPFEEMLQRWRVVDNTVPDLRLAGHTAPFEEMLQRWRVVGNTVHDLTGPKFKHQTSRSKDEGVTTRPTGRWRCKMTY